VNISKCPHKARLYGKDSCKICHKCLPVVQAYVAARDAVSSIVSTAERYANHALRADSFIDDPEKVPLYEQDYVDTAANKLIRAGSFAVEGARRAAPFLSLPWAVGVRAADVVWNYGQYGLLGFLLRSEIMQGLKNLLSLSSSLRDVQPRDLLVGILYLSAEQRKALRDNPLGPRDEAAAKGQELPSDLLEVLMGLAVLGTHAMYADTPFEVQRYALQQNWRLVTERLVDSGKHQPAWCLYIRHEQELAVLSIRGTAVEQSRGGDLLTDMDAVPTRVIAYDGTAIVAHGGMLESARALESELRQTVRVLVARGYYVALTGHSLGPVWLFCLHGFSDLALMEKGLTAAIRSLALGMLYLQW